MLYPSDLQVKFRVACPSNELLLGLYGCRPNTQTVAVYYQAILQHTQTKDNARAFTNSKHIAFKVQCIEHFMSVCIDTLLELVIETEAMLKSCLFGHTGTCSAMDARCICVSYSDKISTAEVMQNFNEGRKLQKGCISLS